MHLRRWITALGAAGLAIWFAALLLPAPPLGDPALAPAQRLLRQLALTSSEEGFAMFPEAHIWLDASSREARR